MEPSPIEPLPLASIRFVWLVACGAPIKPMGAGAPGMKKSSASME